MRPRILPQSPGRRAAVVHRRPGDSSLPGAGRLRSGRLLVASLVLAKVAACAGPDVPAEWTVELEEVCVLGGEPATAETAFYMPAALGSDFRSNLYVLDSGNHRVQVFDSEGRFLRSLGTYGNAPGQLSSPMGMWVYPDGSVIIADARNSRLQPFGASGSPLDPVSVEFSPLDVVGTKDRLFVLRLPQASMIMGPDPRGLVHVLDRASGAPVDTFLEPVGARAGLFYLLQNSFSMAPAPAGGLALGDLHFSSRVRLFSGSGVLRREIPVLYKAGAWAPLGYRPDRLNDTTLDTIARTSSDLAWDPVRRLYWVLSGNSDRSPDGEWVIGHELYRYDAAGEYRGSAMLSTRGTVVHAAPDGKIWLIDDEGVVHAFVVHDPDMKPLTQES